MVNDTAIELLSRLKEIYRLQKGINKELDLVNIHRKDLSDRAMELTHELVNVQNKLCELLKEDSDE